MIKLSNFINDLLQKLLAEKFDVVEFSAKDDPTYDSENRIVFMDGDRKISITVSVKKEDTK